jgi:hypothetical protein
MTKPKPRQPVAPALDPIDIIEAMDLFRRWFKGPSWDTWRAILKAAYALPLSEDELAIFHQVAGERDPPAKQVKELWCVGGRRGGKDSIASLIAAHAAAFCSTDVLAKLRPGERALVMCLAVDRDQARIVLSYTKEFFERIPALHAMVTRTAKDGFELCNGIDVVVATNSYRATRGRTVLIGIFDECAFWQSEQTARPDSETYNAVLPSMASLPGSLLVGISTPHRKSGLLYAKFKKHYAESDDNVLVIKAATATLNPTIDEAIIARAMEDNPEKARAEWLAEFRDDISTFADPEAIEACVMRGVRELPPARGVRYHGFCDPSGGASDSMTAAVCHRGGDQIIVDAIRERKAPFSPTDACLEMAAMFKSYNISTVQADKYAGQWPVESFAACGIRIEQSARPKSELYGDLLPLINAKRIALLDHPRLISQLCTLERSTSRIGKDTIDHADNCKDDVCNAVAGAACLAIQNVGVVVSAELLQRVMQMPVNPHRANHAWGWRKRQGLAVLASMIPSEKRVMPASVLPASKFEKEKNDEAHA